MTNEDCALLLARKIAAKALRDRKMPSPSYEAYDVEAGNYDEHSAVQSALAAINETTRLAAEDAKNMTEKHGKAIGSDFEEGQNDMGARLYSRLTAYEHLPADGGE